MGRFSEIVRREVDVMASAVEGISGLCVIAYAVVFLAMTASGSAKSDLTAIGLTHTFGPVHWAIIMIIIGFAKLACMFKPSTPKCSVITSYLVSLACFYCSLTELVYMKHLDPLVPFALALGILNLVVIRHNGRKLQDKARG